MGRTSPEIAVTARKGLRIERRYTHSRMHPYDQVAWDRRTAAITNDKGKVIFEQKDVEVPETWSPTATNVVVSKYFKSAVDRPGRESSVRQLIDRVALTIGEWGGDQGYFADPNDAESFKMELTHLLLHQMLAFNSPVWFNLGIVPRPQISACFINSVDDDMVSILTLAKTEGMLFKWGSGTGTNLSTIRSSKERLSSGGWASGPVSFMRGYDAFAGVIRSGGKTRRAAKMVILNIDHPDVAEFIRCKHEEEKKAWALIEAGYDGSFGGEAYNSIFFQNSNNSVRVSDEFMRACEEDREWTTRAVVSGEVVDRYRAKDLLRMIAESAHACGDPGLQYDTTINDWNTVSNTDRINATNPCGEYIHLDDTACNLASLNLRKFQREDGSFDVDSFKHAVRISITAQEILVDNASYPTEKISENSPLLRPLGLGYANLGALLMSRGLPYDSDEGRAYAGSITALMTGEANRVSSEIAETKGAFAHFEKNREPMLRVMRKHQAGVEDIDANLAPTDVLDAARDAWADAIRGGEKYGYRNSQVSVLAPTGTIGFMMDCDTMGVEPDIALVKYKKMVGGGLLKLVNQTVPESLRTLGYKADEIEGIMDHVDEQATIEGAPGLKEEHLPVFDCAFKPANGNRTIHYLGHVDMVAAVQPFLSGGVSKTINMPEDTTVEDIEKAYVAGWKKGLKALALYRDGCKKAQPLNTSLDKVEDKKKKVTDSSGFQPIRRRLPDERKSITHKFSVGGHEGYITVGMYEDGLPGEIFVTMAKEGSVVSGLMDCVATATSISLQYGVPMKVLVNKFSHTRFEPAGFTNNKQIPIAKSVMDYIFRWLALKFLPTEQRPPEAVSAGKGASLVADAPTTSGSDGNGYKTQGSLESREQEIFQAHADAPPCPECGSIMVRNAACYQCLNCGSTSGCG
ncbi:MAG: vitamin B12-dependent ribonucleotide reductase [Planctomycetota bacterium]|nr:vitamin B12-dependent ribonucleotide reductase [Planctomycetota bacterium]